MITLQIKTNYVKRYNKTKIMKMKLYTSSKNMLMKITNNMIKIKIIVIIRCQESIMNMVKIHVTSYRKDNNNFKYK